MTRGKFLGIFYRSWWLQFHYIPLTLIAVAVVFLAHYLGEFFSLESLAQTRPFLGYFIMFIWYSGFVYLALSISDQIIHAIGDLFGLKD